MISVVQRVVEAHVGVDGQVIARIGPGLVALVAVERDDTPAQAKWMAEKLVTMRIFPRGEKHFELDIRQSGGAILLVSNFTVAAATRKGRRPSFDRAADPEHARGVFEHLVQSVAALGVSVQTGRFGAMMQVTMINDGPATFIVRTDEPQPPANA